MIIVVVLVVVAIAVTSNARDNARNTKLSEVAVGILGVVIENTVQGHTAIATATTR